MSSYTITDSEGHVQGQRLTVKQAAETLLALQGYEYEIRPMSDGYVMWTRNQAKSVRWQRTDFYSTKPLGPAQDEIFWRYLFTHQGDYEVLPEIL